MKIDLSKSVISILIFIPFFLGCVELMFPQKDSDKDAEIKISDEDSSTEVTSTTTAESEKTPDFEIINNEWVELPGGIFTMGDNTVKPDESFKVFVNSFYIQKYEVSNKDYAEFLNINGNVCNGQPCIGEKSEKVRIHFDGDNWLPVVNMEDHPVTKVTWYGASEFCKEIGGDLPTEAEWEFAARGFDGRKYPSVDGIKRDTANFSNKFNEGRTEQTFKNAAGKSSFTLFNMAGNVREWVRDWYAPDYFKTLGSDIINPLNQKASDQMVLKGGGWIDELDKLTTFSRMSSKPADSYQYTGFRCAKYKKNAKGIEKPSDFLLTINNGEAETENPELDVNLTASDKIGIVSYCLQPHKVMPPLNDSCWNKVEKTIKFELSIKYSYKVKEEGKLILNGFIINEIGNVSSANSSIDFHY